MGIYAKRRHLIAHLRVILNGQVSIWKITTIKCQLICTASRPKSLAVTKISKISESPDIWVITILHIRQWTVPKDSPLCVIMLSPIPLWMGGVLGGEGFGEGEAEGFGNAFAVCRVSAVAVANMSLFDKEFRIAHCACSILASRSLILLAHQSP